MPEDALIMETLSMIEVSGALAFTGGRPMDDNPYDRSVLPRPWAAWHRGWTVAKQELLADCRGTA